MKPLLPVSCAVALALTWAPAPLHAALLDGNLTEAAFNTDGALVEVTGLDWAPDDSNRLFVILKGGEVRIIQNGTLLGTPFATITPIFLNSECGLIGMAFDPNFLVNQYVYFFVTVSMTEQQIIRYTANGNLGIDKTVIVPGLDTVGQNHDGGGLAFGNDGLLYWAIGDNGNGRGVNADLTRSASKVSRGTRDGLPLADNPFFQSAGNARSFIWARGFRNPFTIAFQRTTGNLWVNSVGTDYEQIFVTQAGDHAGYDDFEADQPSGFIRPIIKYRTSGNSAQDDVAIAMNGASRSGNVVTITTASNHLFLKGERLTITGVSDVSFNGTFVIQTVLSATQFTYAQNAADATSGGGTARVNQQLDGTRSAVGGGTFYLSTLFPSEYWGDYFFTDFVKGEVYRAVLDSSDAIESWDVLSDNQGSAIDIALGPDGALYYARHFGGIWRLSHTAPAQQLVVTPTKLVFDEGGQAMAYVRLATSPGMAGLTVNVARTGGSTDVSVMAGTTLNFNTTNFAVPQAVRFTADPDADAVNDTAEISVTASGEATRTLDIEVSDDEAILAVGGGGTTGFGMGDTATTASGTTGGTTGVGADTTAGATTAANTTAGGTTASETTSGSTSAGAGTTGGTSSSGGITSGSLTSGGVTSGQTGGGTGSGSGALALIEAWEVTIKSPKPTKSAKIQDGALKKVVGLLNTEGTNQLPKKFTQPDLIELAVLSSNATSATWTAATKVGKANKKGRVKFVSKAVGANLASGEPFSLLARASTNFGVATSPTARVETTAR